MEFNTILLFIIACVITIYFGWNYFSNRLPIVNSKQANDIRYYELKSKYEFLVAVVTFGIAIAVFYGLGTKKEIENNLKSTFSFQIDSLKRHFKNEVDSVSTSLTKVEATAGVVDNKIANVNQRLETYKGSFSKLDMQQNVLSRKGQMSQADLQNLTNTINQIKSKNILKQEFYIVSGLTSRINGDSLYVFKFKELLTTTGDHLPSFSKPPVVIPISGNNSKYFVARTTNDYVSLAYNGSPYVAPLEIPNVDHSYSKIEASNPITLLIYELR